MSLSRPEPGEYGWRGYDIEERLAPRRPEETHGPAVPGPDYESTDEASAAYMARSDEPRDP
jgi:hypothetical protein